MCSYTVAKKVEQLDEMCIRPYRKDFTDYKLICQWGSKFETSLQQNFNRSDDARGQNDDAEAMVLQFSATMQTRPCLSSERKRSAKSTVAEEAVCIAKKACR